LALTLRDFFRRYNGRPHQDAAIQLLEEALPPELMQRRGAEWIEVFNSAPAPKPAEKD
jgi:hypothetical protein